MPIALLSEASLDFVTLQSRVTNEELKVVVRLSNLRGKVEDGVAFNAHVYNSVDNNELPFSKLFVIPDGGSANSDPDVTKWLAQNSSQGIVCEERVYVCDSLLNIAIVR